MLNKIDKALLTFFGADYGYLSCTRIYECFFLLKNYVSCTLF